MKKIFLILGVALMHAASHAQPMWLTVSGDPEDPAVNTIQVDPVPVEVVREMRTMRVRVSRSAPRTSWDGTPYRSYYATVRFDCERSIARYMAITFHSEPDWKGEPVTTTDYSTGTPRLMQFRDVWPNPHQRLMRAACVGISR
jgi:hypothetical protein